MRKIPSTSAAASRLGELWHGIPALRFAAVGIVAGFVDMGVVQILVSVFAADPYVSRVFSYLTAATVAWQLNRAITFDASAAERSLPAEWLSYLYLNLSGAAINYCVYVLLLLAFPVLTPLPAIAAGIGSLSGMAANFFVTNRFLYTRKQSGDLSDIG